MNRYEDNKLGNLRHLIPTMMPLAIIFDFENWRTRRGWTTRYSAASRRLIPDENPLS